MCLSAGLRVLSANFGVVSTGFGVLSAGSTEKERSKVRGEAPQAVP